MQKLCLYSFQDVSDPPKGKYPAWIYFGLYSFTRYNAHMELINLQFEIFILILIGYILAKSGRFSSQTRSQMTSMVLSIFLPASIIQSFMLDMTPEILRSCLVTLLASVGIQIVYWICMKLCWKGISDENKRINLQYGTMVSNAGFMGMPIAQAAYGAQGLLLASIFLIPQRICMWSTGLALYTVTGSWKEKCRKVATHPCIVALAIGVAVMFADMAGFVMPVFLVKSLSACASCSTALSMMIIGAVLSDVPFSEMKDKLSLVYALLRLIAIPAGIWILLLLFHIGDLSIKVCILLCAMPAPSTMVMLAQSYHHDPQFASRLIFVSTLFSLVTLPLWMLILG